MSMRQVAQTAGASSESAKQVLTATERGRLAVQDTVQDMQNIRAAVQRMSKQVKGLGDRSLEISQIVSTIREIASQTNLLALNAAIEAAGPAKRVLDLPSSPTRSESWPKTPRRPPVKLPTW